MFFAFDAINLFIQLASEELSTIQRLHDAVFDLFASSALKEEGRLQFPPLSQLLLKQRLSSVKAFGDIPACLVCHPVTDTGLKQPAVCLNSK